MNVAASCTGATCSAGALSIAHEVSSSERDSIDAPTCCTTPSVAPGRLQSDQQEAAASSSCGENTHATTTSRVAHGRLSSKVSQGCLASHGSRDTAFARDVARCVRGVLDDLPRFATDGRVHPARGRMSGVAVPARLIPSIGAPPQAQLDMSHVQPVENFAACAFNARSPQHLRVVSHTEAFGGNSIHNQCWASTSETGLALNSQQQQFIRQPTQQSHEPNRLTIGGATEKFPPWFVSVSPRPVAAGEPSAHGHVKDTGNVNAANVLYLGSSALPPIACRLPLHKAEATVASNYHLERMLRRLLEPARHSCRGQDGAVGEARSCIKKGDTDAIRQALLAGTADRCKVPAETASQSQYGKPCGTDDTCGEGSHALALRLQAQQVRSRARLAMRLPAPTRQAPPTPHPSPRLALKQEEAEGACVRIEAQGALEGALLASLAQRRTAAHFHNSCGRLRMPPVPHILQTLQPSGLR
eukprot:jgi/Ulvmu1/10800/UM069_0035.1